MDTNSTIVLIEWHIHTLCKPKSYQRKKYHHTRKFPQAPSQSVPRITLLKFIHVVICVFMVYLNSSYYRVEFHCMAAISEFLYPFSSWWASGIFPDILLLWYGYKHSWICLFMNIFFHIFWINT